MSATRAKREEFLAAAHQDHVFAIYLPEGHRSIGKIANGESFSKIAFRFFRLCHIYSRASS
jgi:hypothetical protein